MSPKPTRLRPMTASARSTGPRSARKGKAAGKRSRVETEEGGSEYGEVLFKQAGIAMSARVEFRKRRAREGHW
jgi:hypothetical protein